MKKYCGNSKPYIYVSFPEEKKEQALSVLEKLSASEEGKKLNFWYSDKNTLGGKERKRIEAAHALLVFADGGALADERFRETVNTAADKNRNVMCVHLDELKYDTPWAKTQLGPQQAIKTRDYSNEDELVEKLNTAEIFKDMRVTKEQKRSRRRQLGSLIAAPIALALLLFGGLITAGVVSLEQPEEEPVVSTGDIEPFFEIPETGFSGLQSECDKIDLLVIMGDQQLYFEEKPYDVNATADFPKYKFYKNIGWIERSDNGHDIIYQRPDGLPETVKEGSIDSLEGIAHFRNLRYLVVIGNKITDLSPILELENLRALRLDYNPITSAEGIEKLKNLRYLSLQGTDISEISFGDGMPNLQTLNCGDTNIKSFEGISSCKKLSEFSAAGTGITDIEEVFNCEKLNILNVSNTKLTSLDGISRLKYLEELDIRFSKITKVGSIKSQSLFLSAYGCRIKDFSFLKGIERFTRLMVSGPVKDTLLPAIDGATVDWLEWDNSDLESFSELTIERSDLTYLVQITQSSTLTSLDGVEEFPEIWHLELVGCPNIKSLQPLRRLQNTEEVYLDELLRDKANRQLNGVPFGVSFGSVSPEEFIFGVEDED